MVFMTVLPIMLFYSIIINWFGNWIKTLHQKLKLVAHRQMQTEIDKANYLDPLRYLKLKKKNPFLPTLLNLKYHVIGNTHFFSLVKMTSLRNWTVQVVKTITFNATEAQDLMFIKTWQFIAPLIRGICWVGILKIFLLIYAATLISSEWKCRHEKGWYHWPHIYMYT